MSAGGGGGRAPAGAAPPRDAGAGPCLSDLRLDMWLARDLGADEADRARRHVDLCPACAARLAQLEAGRAAGAPSVPLDALVAAAAGRARAAHASRLPLGLGAGLLAALGAAAAIALLPGRPPGGVAPEEPTGPGAAEAPAGVRTKGRPHLAAFVKRGARVFRLAPGEPVMPGDLVRFATSTEAPFHLLVVGVGPAAGVGAGRSATVYFPVGGAADVVPAGREVPLPRATELDESLGPETIHAFFCRTPLAPAVVDELRLALGARPAPPTPPGCQVETLAWTKVKGR